MRAAIDCIGQLPIADELERVAGKRVQRRAFRACGERLHELCQRRDVRHAEGTTRGQAYSHDGLALEQSDATCTRGVRPSAELRR
jgi:hypothetical protein